MNKHASSQEELGTMQRHMPAEKEKGHPPKQNGNMLYRVATLTKTSRGNQVTKKIQS